MVGWIEYGVGFWGRDIYGRQESFFILERSERDTHCGFDGGGGVLVGCFSTHSMLKGMMKLFFII